MREREGKRERERERERERGGGGKEKTDVEVQSHTIASQYLFFQATLQNGPQYYNYQGAF